jgi:hypothetical protein
VCAQYEERGKPLAGVIQILDEPAVEGIDRRDLREWCPELDKASEAVALRNLEKV